MILVRPSEPSCAVLTVSYRAQNHTMGPRILVNRFLHVKKQKLLVILLALNLHHPGYVWTTLAVQVKHIFTL